MKCLRRSRIGALVLGLLTWRPLGRSLEGVGDIDDIGKYGQYGRRGRYGRRGKTSE